MSVNDFVHMPVWCSTERFILMLNIHGQTTTMNICWHVFAISWRNCSELI